MTIANVTLSTTFNEQRLAINQIKSTLANTANSTTGSIVTGNAKVKDLVIHTSGGTANFANATLTLAASAISSNTYFAAGVVDAAAISNNVSFSLSAGDVDANTKFAAGVVDSAALASNSVGSGEIITGAVGNTELGVGAVTTHAIAAGAIDAGDIGTGGVSANTQLAAGVVTSHAIANGAIDAGDIGTGGVSANTQLAAGVVTTHAIAAGAIDAGDIGTGGVSANTQLAAGVVDTAAIAAGAIDAGDIGAAAISSNTMFAAGVVDAAAISNAVSFGLSAGDISSNTFFAAGVVDTNALASGDLGDLAGLSQTVGSFIQSNGTSWVVNNTQTGRNILENGAMVIDQRGSQAGLGNTAPWGATGHGADRYSTTWYDSDGGRANATVSNDADAPPGFSRSLKYDITTADGSVSGTSYYYMHQKICGHNLQHLKWGTANAAPITFSFWVKTTITGIYTTWFHIKDNEQAYLNEFTVSASDTWEYHSTTFEGCQATNVTNDETWGASVGMMFGGTYAAANTGIWIPTHKYGSSNQVNGVSSISNNILTTGWQLEIGDTATPFEHKSYQQDLDECLWYYEKLEGDSDYNIIHLIGGHNDGTTFHRGGMRYAIKRVEPTITASGASDFDLELAGTDKAPSSVVFYYTSKQGWSDVSMHGLSSLTAGEAAAPRVLAGWIKIDADL